MPFKVRRVAAAAVILLALIITLIYRLDANLLGPTLQKQIEGFTTVDVKSEGHALSFVHGIGLRLERVTISQRYYHIEAGHIDVGIRLLPLLLGKVELDAFDIHDAVISIDPNAVHPTSSAISTLPLEQIRLIRAELRTLDGRDILNDLHLELRNIGLNRETLWELKAQQQDYALGGHGRLNFYHGDIRNGFGKFKLDRFPLNRLQKLAPANLISWLKRGGETISGSLALDISDSDDWAIFGELAYAAAGETSPVRIRGKLEHPEIGRLQWHDSFIHFSEHSVIAINGSCIDAACKMQLDADDVPLKRWQLLLPQPLSAALSGSSDLKAELTWDESGFSGSADALLGSSLISIDDHEFTLPPLQIRLNSVTGAGNEWQTSAEIRTKSAQNSVQLEMRAKQGHIDSARLRLQKSSSELWLPVGNLLLHSLAQPSTLDGEGSVDADISYQRGKQSHQLQIEMQAKAAAIRYDEIFSKPENITAACKAEIHWGQSSRRTERLHLNACQLDHSDLNSLTWRRVQKQQHLSIERLMLNLDQLHQHAVHLPPAIDPYIGLIEISGSSRWPEGKYWYSGFSGKLRMQNFGTPTWHANAAIEARQGRFATPRLLLEGNIGKIESKGWVSLPDRRGEIDILGADIDLSSLPDLPQAISDIALRGRLHHGSMLLLNNRFDALHGYYRLHRGKVRLENMHAQLAEGKLLISNMLITPQQQRYGIDGNLKLKGAELSKLNLNGLSSASLSGSLHANIELHGKLGEMSAAAWQQSNGDMLIYSGSWQPEAKATTLTERLGIKSPESTRFAFRKLEWRFRVEEDRTLIKPLHLHAGAFSGSGQGEITADGLLSGAIGDKQQTYRFSGAWQKPEWQQITPAP